MIKKVRRKAIVLGAAGIDTTICRKCFKCKKKWSHAFLMTCPEDMLQAELVLEDLIKDCKHE